MTPEQLLCVAAYFNQAVRWRFNWYRQITAGQVGRVIVSVPTYGGKPDADSAKALAGAVPYWGYLKERLKTAT